MIYNLLQKRRYVVEYDENYHIPKSLINSLLMKAWTVTPSKNNFMPYTVHVVGPEKKDIKEKVFLNCLSNEGYLDDVKDPLKRYNKDIPKYANILTCSYLFIFTMRLETDPNPYQKVLISKGHRYEAVDESKLNELYPMASFEVGLFADALSGLCLEENIDVSFTGCFHRDVNYWKDVPFVKRKPIILMTAGKALKYKTESKIGNIVYDDRRPDYHRIINFIE